MSELLAGLLGVLCQMDDVLIWGRNYNNNVQCLEAALKHIEEAGATLNPQKCEFNKRKITFLDCIIDTESIRADPEKTEAIRKMRLSTSVSELTTFMGMTNQLGKFTPNLAEITQPLCELLSKSRSYTWGPTQSKAFTLVKEELLKPTILAFYHPATPTKISADASSHGLKAVLLQEVKNSWKPVAFASQSLSDTEQ